MYGNFKNWLKLKWILIYHRFDYMVDWIGYHFDSVFNGTYVGIGKRRMTRWQQLTSHQKVVVRYEVMVREYLKLCKYLKIDAYRTNLLQVLTIDHNDRIYVRDQNIEKDARIEVLILLLTSSKIRRPLYEGLQKLGDIEPNRINRLGKVPQEFYFWLNSL